MAPPRRAAFKNVFTPVVMTRRQLGQFLWKPSIFSEISWYPTKTRFGPQIWGIGGHGSGQQLNPMRGVVFSKGFQIKLQRLQICRLFHD
jgi:hypothetical protein